MVMWHLVRIVCKNTNAENVQPQVVSGTAWTNHWYPFIYNEIKRRFPAKNFDHAFTDFQNDNRAAFRFVHFIDYIYHVLPKLWFRLIYVQQLN